MKNFHPVSYINPERPEKLLEMYAWMQTQFNYPKISDKEDNLDIKGKLVAIAFGYLIKEYRLILTTYEDWEDRGQELAEMGIFMNMPEAKQALCKEFGVEFEWAREDFWSPEDNWPEFDGSDVHEIHNSLISHIQKQIIADLLSYFGTQQKVGEYFFTSFDDIVTKESNTLTFDYNQSGENHEFRIVQVPQSQLKEREIQFWNQYVLNRH